MRYRLRTLLILLAAGPPMLAALHWKVEQYRSTMLWEKINLALQIAIQNERFRTGYLPPGTRWRKPPRPDPLNRP